MKKIPLAVLIGLISVVLVYGLAYAIVSGGCYVCHTMHNSQNALPMNYDDSPTPNGLLLRGDCVGCHGQEPTGASNIINSIPQVLHSDTIDLAGGNFRYVVSAMGGSEFKGHNVEGIEIEDTVLGSTPPGYDSAYDPSTVGYNDAARLTCAGSNGCHGNRDETGNFAGIKGGHHGDDSVLKFGTIAEGSQGADVATSYRFLYKVKGGEDADWQDTVGATDHNEYKGQIFAARANQNWTTIDTISELCAECHGVFHMSSGIGTASPWLRHPTDAILPATGEYQYYNGAGNPYSLEAPVARATIPNSPGDTVIPGTDIVMCLSCHRAHASEYAHSFGGAADTAGDILRWDYDTMVAGGGGGNIGCFICHTTKD